MTIFCSVLISSVTPFGYSIEIFGLKYQDGQTSNPVEDPQNQDDDEEEGEEFELLGVRFLDSRSINVTQGFRIQSQFTATSEAAHDLTQRVLISKTESTYGINKL